MTSQVDYDFSLAGKVAVVTGGASGIGEAIVDAYAAKGASVVVLDKAVDVAQRAIGAVGWVPGKHAPSARNP